MEGGVTIVKVYDFQAGNKVKDNIIMDNYTYNDVFFRTRGINSTVALLMNFKFEYK